MFGFCPLSCLRQDYKSTAEVEKDFFGGKDFRAANGQYTSIRDAKSLGLKQVEIRYNKLKNVCMVEVK